MTVAALLISFGIILLIAGVKGLSVTGLLFARPQTASSGSLLQ